jgi:hypothetical protein
MKPVPETHFHDVHAGTGTGAHAEVGAPLSFVLATSTRKKRAPSDCMPRLKK